MLYIDISYYQNPKQIDYDTLAKEVDGVICRVGFTGYGTGKDCNLDSAFFKHHSEFKKRGVPVGAYYFGVAMTEDMAKKEAEFVLKHVKPLELELPIFYDTESSGDPSGKIGHEHLTKNKLTNVVQTFCETIEEAGYYVGIYASEWWFNNNMVKSKLTQFDWWVANWFTKPSISHGIWQYSSDGRLNGYNGRLDVNNVYKDYPTIIRNAGLNNIMPYAKPLHLHTVQKGDTLYELSKRFDSDVKTIAICSDVKQVDMIHVGDTLRIPTNKRVHRVKANDTLYKLSSMYDVSVDRLVELNKIKDKNTIHVGELLVVES